jgi:hypothetical protein
MTDLFDLPQYPSPEQCVVQSARDRGEGPNPLSTCLDGCQPIVRIRNLWSSGYPRRRQDVCIARA